MVARIATVAFQGIRAVPIDVQVSVAGVGSPKFNIVGLADKAVAESKERVRAALAAVGLGLPRAASPSTWRRPISPRKAVTTTCRSRWAFWSNSR